MTAASNSLAMLVGAQLAANSALHNHLETSKVEDRATRAAWSSVEDLAGCTMLQEPRSDADVLLQLTIAALWVDSCVETTGMNTSHDNLVRGIVRTLEHAALHLNRTVRLDDGPCADYVAGQIAQLINCGAELPEATHTDPERKVPWSNAHERYLRAKAAADAVAHGTDKSDQAFEDEGLALDELIENVPAPDGRALATKIIIAMERAKGFDVAMYDDHAAAILADARRLEGVA